MELKRGIDPEFLAAISNPAGFYPIVFIRSVWPDGTVYLHSGKGQTTWDGETWKGVGDISSFQIGAEGSGAVPSAAGMSIAAALEVVLEYTTEEARGGEVEFSLGATTAPGNPTLIGDPYLAFTGYVDNNEMEFSAMGAAALEVGFGTGPAARDGAAITHSAEDQKKRYPGDTFFERTAHATAYRNNPPLFPNPS